MKKSTLLALVVFAVLAVIAFSTLGGRPERGVSRLDLTGVAADSIDAVVLGDDDDAIRIEKSEGEWRVDGKRADARAVDRMIESLVSARSGDLATRKAERFAELEVDEENGARVRLVSGDRTVADVTVGGSATNGSYVRSDDEVFSVRGLYRAVFARDRAAWIEKKLFFDDVADVERVRVEAGVETPFAIEKQGDVWQLAEPASLPPGQRFDASAAERFASALATARAQEVLDEAADSPDFEAAQRVVFRVAGDDGERTLEIGEVVDGSAKVRSSARGHLLSLREATVDSLVKSLADLRDWSIVSFDPKQATRLEVVSEGASYSVAKSDDRWQVTEASDELPEDFALDSTAVNRRLIAISRLTAVAEAEAPIDTAADPQARIAVTGEDGSVAEVAFFGDVDWDGKPTFAAVGNVDERVYLVTESNGERVLQGVESLARAESAPGGLGQIDPAALQNLPPEVRESLMKQMAEERQRQELMQKVMEAEAQK